MTAPLSLKQMAKLYDKMQKHNILDLNSSSDVEKALKKATRGQNEEITTKVAYYFKHLHDIREEYCKQNDINSDFTLSFK